MRFTLHIIRYSNILRRGWFVLTQTRILILYTFIIIKVVTHRRTFKDLINSERSFCGFFGIYILFLKVKDMRLVSEEKKLIVGKHQ